jgi:hypothetical protein
MKRLEFNTFVESSVYNILNRNKDHANCSLIIKASYKTTYRTALYCVEHDFFLTWINEHHFDEYKKLGINHVEYPENKYTSLLFSKDNNWAVKENLTMGDPEITTKVKNYRSGKKVDLWVAFKGDPYRDPSMPEYWKFVESHL